MVHFKPDFGIEIQTFTCTKSGVLCQLKLMKSKVKMTKANFIKKVPPNENASTTAIKQLSQLWYQSNWIVIANSVFASVAIATKMHQLGMGFISCVKIATKLFPVETLKLVHLPNSHSNYFSIMVMKEGVELLAFTWCDCDRHSFIATSGSLAKADEQEHFCYQPIDQDTSV